MLGVIPASPTYCRTTNGFGFNVLDAASLPNKEILVNGRETILPDFWYPETNLWSSLTLTSLRIRESSLDCGLRTDCCESIAHW